MIHGSYNIFQDLELIICSLQLAATASMVTILNTALRKSNFADLAEITGHFEELFIMNAVKSATGSSYEILNFRSCDDDYLSLLAPEAVILG